MAAADRFIVVVGIDFSEPGDRALEKALEIAGGREGGEVHVLYVAPEGWLDRFGGTGRDDANADASLRLIEEHAAERMKAVEARLGKLRRVVAHFRQGSPAESLTQLAGEIDADLVVVGSNGHRGFGPFLGTVAEQVTRLARCPVWIVRPKGHRAERRAAPVGFACPECLRLQKEAPGAGLRCAAHAGRRSQPPRYTYATNGIYAAEATVYEAAPSV